MDRIKKIISKFDFNQKEKIIILINKILDREKELNKELLDIYCLHLEENKIFQKEFEQINNESLLKYLVPHIDLIYSISKKYSTLYSALYHINEIFNMMSIRTDRVKRYYFPLYFMQIISENFISEISNCCENNIIFHSKKNVTKRVNYINYVDFLYKKILSIMIDGVNYSNLKAVENSTTFVFGRRGNK